MKETTQTNLPTFPVELYGHSLKYEIECMLKIFLPATKFVFSYETASLLRSAEQGAFLQLKPGKTNLHGFSACCGIRENTAAVQQSCRSAHRKKTNRSVNISSAGCCSRCCRI